MLTLPPSSLNYSPKCPSQEAVNWGSVSQNLYLEDCLPKNDIAVAVKNAREFPKKLYSSEFPEAVWPENFQKLMSRHIPSKNPKTVTVNR